jgi:hypothetical protein
LMAAFNAIPWRATNLGCNPAAGISGRPVSTPQGKTVPGALRRTLKSLARQQLSPQSDRTVQVANLDMGFSKAYYMDQAAHRADGSGYRSRFKVREASP